MSILRVRGTSEPGEEAAVPPLGRFGEIVGVKAVEAVRVGDVRGAAVQEVPVGEDQVVELEMEGGIRLWTSAERLHEMLEDAGQRSTRGGEILLPTRLPVGPPSRGGGGFALRVLKLLKVDVAGMTSRVIAEKLEGQLEPAPGLYRCPSVKTLERPVAAGDTLPGGTPLLLFLHGTASSTSGSFGAFAEAAGAGVWEKLTRRYRENIFALEHRTLTESPIQNALEVARRLPGRGGVLHLVSHSRGGLIGELLCRGQAAGQGAPFDALALRRFSDPARARDLEALRELGELLAEKRPRVERFVRVACPARGTTLASGRLDLYLSILLNAVGLVPFLRGNPAYEFLSALVLAVARKRTDPSELPGIEAMVPDSPLVKVLNDANASVDADLSVIAGDVQGAGLVGRLKIFATDLFYRENHDLVVHSRSMLGGTARTGGSRFAFDKGSEVTHFQYFCNKKTADLLYRGLTRADGDDAGYERADANSAESLRTRGAAPEPGSRPVLFLLPGMMGTRLDAGGDAVWLDPAALARGDFPRLATDRTDVEDVAILRVPYERLTDYLSTWYEVVEFPYDWRCSLADAADRLADAVGAKLDSTTHPVSILAHSAGGLVARVMVARNPQLWSRLVERKGSRLVMLGTPNGGSHNVVRMLLGQERIVRYLAMLHPDPDAGALTAPLSRFPGLLEMLPAAPAAADFFGSDAWSDLAAAWSGGWTVPDAAALAAAAKLRKELAEAPVDPEHMVYVAGSAPATPIGWRVDTSRQGAARIRFLATSRGDGRVPWSTGAPPGVKTWYMPVPHGNLADHPPHFPALRELLEKGSTTLLDTRPPLPELGAEETFLMEPDEPFLFPDARELEAAAVGMDPELGTRDEDARLEVKVLHGNLSFVSSPVAVGHYTGDVIAGAEKALDRLLDGRLGVRRQLGLYPGPLGTSEVFLARGGSAPGAIVVGLGDVGKLTGAGLERSFTQAVLDFAVRKSEAEGGSGELQAGVTALLIGSGRGGISTEDSVRAIVRGTVRAREILKATPLPRPVRIESLQFCELYEDVAILALRILGRLQDEGRSGMTIRVQRELAIGTGGRRRAWYGDEPEWWDRLQVQAEGDDGLAFLSLTNRARAEKQFESHQRGVVDQFVRDIAGSVRDDPALTKTLFELLMPNELKEYAPDRTNLVMIVDAAAARYPWEMLRDDASEAREPLAVRSGLVRQFATATYRARVNTPIGNDVLVVGDPPTKAFRPLPGAAREAEAVAGLFQAKPRYSVTPLVRSGFAAILQALYEKPYRVMHLAAHGVYDYPLPDGEDGPRADGKPKTVTGTVPGERDPRADGKPRTVTGMVLGDGAFLRADELKKLPGVPELVFLNGCHLGKIEPGQAPAPAAPAYPRLAASLAEELIKMGVRAVVAAGWEVQDDAALTFARTFYHHMLEGDTFGEAVLRARRVTHSQHPGINTWGAYQCYGDPGYILERPSDRPYTEPPPEVFTCAREVEMELANLSEDAGTTSAHGPGTLEERLVRIEGGILEPWRQEPGVIAALARAYAELGRFDDAIAAYRRLLALEKADYPVTALEQLANLASRQALRRWTEARAAGAAEPPPELAEVVRRAIDDLESLPGKDSRSAERSGLIGSAYKRLSWMTTTEKDRSAALRKMAAAYRAGHEVAAARAELDTYALLNWLAAEVLTSLRASGTRKARSSDLDRWLELAEKATVAREAGKADFWSGVARAEAAVVEHLDARDLGASVDAIIEEYRRAWVRGGSTRHLASVEDQLGWLAEMLRPISPRQDESRNDNREAVEALEKIRAAVRAFSRDTRDE